MKLILDWTVFLNTTTQEKSLKVIQRVSELVSIDFSSATIERYWKDKDLFKVSARCHINGTTRPDTYYGITRSLKPIANRWVISLPDEEGALEFNATANPADIRIQGINSISIEVSEVAEEQPSFGTESLAGANVTGQPLLAAPDPPCQKNNPE